jgi:putative DNA primase/helicase
MSTAQDFQRAIATSGLTPPKTIIADGSLHRFSSNGQSGDTAGWYMLRDDHAAPAGSFGCWRTGLQSTWCGKSGKAMTPAEREAHNHRIKAIKAQCQAEETVRHKIESDNAVVRFLASSTPDEHSYLTFKSINAYSIKQDGQVLLIPLRDINGKLHSLQTISGDGIKRFKGRLKGCYHSIGKPNNWLIVCEGYATGATIHEATGEAVAVAFTAGNLELVATALHRKYPSLTIVMAADDDWCTASNPGLTAAKSAAKAVGGFIVVPQFPANRPSKATDFNDLAALAGLDAARAAFAELKEAAC